MCVWCVCARACACVCGYVCVGVCARVWVCVDYVIHAGEVLNDSTYSDDIELLNYKQSSHWVIARISYQRHCGYIC